MELFVKRDSDGPPLLLIHGIVSDHTFFDGIIPGLAGRWHTIAYDRRGYGMKGEPPIDYSLDAQAEDARQILAAEAARRPAGVLAHSGGGRIALRLASMYPELVRFLVLIDPAFGCDPADAPRLNRFHASVADFARQGKLLPALPVIARAAGELSRPRQGAREGEDGLTRVRRNLKNFMYGERLVLHGSGPSLEELRRLTVPTMVGITGGDALYASVTRNDVRLLGWPSFDLPEGHNCLRAAPEACLEPLLRVMEVLDNAQKEGNDNVGSQEV